MSSAGGAWGTITGTGFQAGVVVTFGGVEAQSAFVLDPQTLYFVTAAHAAGAVDVVVRYPGGSADTVVRALTYVAPESLDFNGSWLAHSGSDYEIDMGLAIEDNRLVSVTCGDSPPVVFTTPHRLSRGEFEVHDQGVSVSGVIVAEGAAVGTIDVAPCATHWWANRR